ncbi:MAG: insulinase family protein [Oscillospiraceae bacterium]|nr:insulinase family protein [Oscillospiraceae bacterium]
MMNNKLNQAIHHRVLSNGLNVYVLPKPGYHKTFALYGTHYGGVDVNFTANGVTHHTPYGVAHFLEHKMFDMPDGQNALETLAANGANPNAYTSVDLTAYLIECTSRFAENLTALLTFVNTPYFTPETVEKEKGIIGQEIKMIEDRPHSMIFYNMLTGLYAEHPISVPIAGTQDSVAKITDETLNACYQHFYNPAQMALCVAGDVDIDEVCRIAEAVPGGAPAVGDVVREYGNENHAKAKMSVYQKHMAVGLPLFMLGCKLSPSSYDSFCAELESDLACELIAGKSSPLYARLYAEGLINDNYQYGYFGFSGGACGLFGGESRDPAAFQAALLDEWQRVKKTGVDTAHFVRLKRAAYGQWLRQLDDSEALCRNAMNAHFNKRDAFTFPEIFENMTIEAVMARLDTMLSAERMCLSRIDPAG